MNRILTAIVLIAFVIGLVFFGKLWMITLLCALVAGLAAHEFRQLSAAGGSPVPLWWTIAAVALFFVATFFATTFLAVFDAARTAAHLFF